MSLVGNESSTQGGIEAGGSKQNNAAGSSSLVSVEPAAEVLNDLDGVTFSIKDEPVVKEESNATRSIVLREVDGHLVQEVDITAEQLLRADTEDGSEQYELVQIDEGGANGEPQYVLAALPESSQYRVVSGEGATGTVVVYKDEPIEKEDAWQSWGSSSGDWGGMSIVVGPDDIKTVSNVEAISAIQSLMPNTRVIAPRGRPLSAHTEEERVVNRREKDRVRKQVLRMNSDYRDKEKEQSRLRMRKLRRDPVYRQRERDRDCLRRRLSRRYNSEMRNKEKEREKLHKRLVKTLSDLYMTNHSSVKSESDIAAQVVEAMEGENYNIEAADGASVQLSPLAEEQAYARKPVSSQSHTWTGHDIDIRNAVESAIAAEAVGDASSHVGEEGRQYVPADSVIEVGETGQVVSMSDGQLVAQVVAVDGSDSQVMLDQEGQVILDENGQEMQVITLQDGQSVEQVVSAEVVAEETVLDSEISYQAV